MIARSWPGEWHSTITGARAGFALDAVRVPIKAVALSAKTGLYAFAYIYKLYACAYIINIYAYAYDAQ